jgi:serine/threonine protein kinase
MPFYASTLRRELSKAPPLGQRDPVRALRLFDGLLSGVEAAHHMGVVHRDLKPENILVDAPSDGLVVADFGIARFSEEASLATFVETSEGERLASWRYAAPEQKKPGGDVDHRADIFTLGLILCEIFTGEVPEGTSPTRIAATTPSHGYLDDLVDALLKTRPDERPQTVRDVKGLLLSKGNEFISLQKLSKFERTTVPAATVDDPLVLTPPELVDVNVVPARGALEIVFELTRPVTDEWKKVLSESPIGYSLNYPPSRFRFEGKTARGPLFHTAEAQTVRDHFKSWLEQMKVHYRRHAEELARRKAESERASLAAEKRLAEELLRINRSLKS